MALFRSIDELKAALGTVHQSLAFETLESFVDQAQLLHLQPYVGEALLAELEAALDAEAGPSPVQAALLKHLRRALAYYVVLEAAPQLAVAFSDMGLSEQSADRATPARQWVYNNFVDSAAGNADTLLDTALFWLEAKESAFPTWQQSEAYTVSRELLLRSTWELSKLVNIAQSRRTFLALRPYLVRVEELQIAPALGQARYDALKISVLSPLTVSVADKTLWELAKPALAHLALAEALPELALQVSSAGVRVLADNDGIRERRAAAPAQVSALVQNHERLATQYLARLTQYCDGLRTATEEPRARRIIDNTGSKAFRV